MADASGAPGVWGRFARELSSVVDETNMDALLAKVRSAPRGLSIEAYIELCYQAASGSAVTDSPKVRPGCDNCGGSGLVGLNDSGEAIPCRVCNPTVVASCETVDGGVAP